MDIIYAYILIIRNLKVVYKKLKILSLGPNRGNPNIKKFRFLSFQRIVYISLHILIPVYLLRNNYFLSFFIKDVVPIKDCKTLIPFMTAHLLIPLFYYSNLYDMDILISTYLGLHLK